MSTAAMDRISSLPDDILIHFLSFVSTKQAFATSILSKRWMHLCQHVSNLDFSDTKLSNLADNDRFNQFVYSILRRQKAAGNHSINTFILDIEYPYELYYSCISNIEKWVNIVVKRKVQYIHLYTHSPVNREDRTTTLPRLPKHILSCTTLVGLKLRLFSVYKDACSLLNLPSLKTLHLKDIYFPQLRDFMMLLDGCPVLEDLQLSNIDLFRSYTHHPFDNFKSNSMLRKLNRADITMCYFYIPIKSLSNLEFLRIQLSKDYHPCYDFPTFLNLTHLVLNYDWDTVFQVIKHCSKLQNLELYQILQGYQYQWLGLSKIWVDPEFVPSCLSFNLTTCTMRDFAYAGRQHNHIMLARFILKNARVLQTLKIWCNNKQSEIERQLSRCPRASATCQLSIY